MKVDQVATVSEARIAALEGQLRTLKFALILLPILALMLGAAGDDGKATAAKVINTERINLVDKDGKRRIEIGVDEDRPYIILTDKEGGTKLYLGMNAPDGSPSLLMRDKAGTERIYLGVKDEKTGPFMRFAGPDGTAWQHMGRNGENGVPYIELDDETGKLLWGVGGNAVKR